jgi:hypothetical protein
VITTVTGSSFVDDTGLGVMTNSATTSEQNSNVEDLNQVVQQLQTLAQHWERLLFTTGGALNLQKSFWYLLSWEWKNGHPKLVTCCLSCSSGCDPVMGDNRAKQ